MRKVIKEFPKVVLKSYRDKKEELDEFFTSLILEPADEEHYYIIKSKKQDFLDWLKINYLNTLLTNFDITEPRSEFEWQCRQEILTYLAKFDFYLLQCIRNQQELENIQRMDIYLRKKMTKFNKNYNIGDTSELY